jgi:hypothetical protein
VNIAEQNCAGRLQRRTVGFQEIAGVESRWLDPAARKTNTVLSSNELRINRTPTNGTRADAPKSESSLSQSPNCPHQTAAAKALGHALGRK